MRKLRFIQEFVGSKLLRFKAKKVTRTLQSSNFEQAKTIGIIYDAIDQNRHQRIAGFADNLMKTYDVTVQMVGFVSNAELTSVFFGQFGCKYVTKSDFSWYGIATNSIITDFINTPFDILLDLSLEPIYPLLYMNLLSKAKFKVGRYEEHDLHNDLMIDTKKDNSIDNLIEQIQVYLSMLKVK